MTHISIFCHWAGVGIYSPKIGKVFGLFSLLSFIISCKSQHSLKCVFVVVVVFHKNKVLKEDEHEDRRLLVLQMKLLVRVS
jgi:hypothetical protein